MGSKAKATARTITVHPRPRLAIWASHALAVKGEAEALLDQAVDPNQAGHSFFDDLSSLTGVRCQAADPTKAEWDPRVPQGAPNNAARHARFAEVIKHAHARGVQVSMGFEAVDSSKLEDVLGPDGKPVMVGGKKKQKVVTVVSEESKRFMAFVRKASKKQTVKNKHGETVVVPDTAVIQSLVDNIVAFMFTDAATKLPWDGINFDLEIVSLGPRYRPVIRELFHRLHDHPKMAGKWVAYATFGYTGRLVGRNGAPAPFSFAKVQTFELATGKPRLVARPMLYEGIIDEPYLKAVIDYAFKPAAQGGAGMERQQLELGLQGDLQPGQAARPSKITDNTEVIPLIKNLFRRHVVGIIYFMLFRSTKVDTARMKFFETIHDTYTKRP